MQPAEPARSGTGFSAPESPARLKETGKTPPRASKKPERIPRAPQRNRKESPARLKETEENPPRASLELEFREVRNKIREVRNRTHALIENAHSR